MASSNVVDQYISEFGYKPESVPKLMNFVKDKGLSMKYGAVKKAFEQMKDGTQSTTPARDIIKSEATNLDVNKSKINIDLVPTPEAEEAQQKKETQQQQATAETESKTWTFDVTKATEAIEVFGRLHKNSALDADTLPQILEWANNDENKYGITMGELKQAYSQKKAFAAMDLPSNKKKKRKTKKKTKKKKDDIDITDEKLELVPLKSMQEFCTNDVLCELLKLYNTQWNHDPLDGKQLLNFMDEQEVATMDAKYQAINFEIINSFFQDYGDYKQQIEIKNIKIKSKSNVMEKRKTLNEFNCKETLNKYIESHGEPKDTTMFYKYVLELGYSMEFKELDDAYNAAKGVQKKKKKKVKINRTSKRLKSLYKKGKSAK